MKIKALKPLNNGSTEIAAEGIWNKAEGFAAYGFNKSHAVEYTVLSWWAMWVKVTYPAEFYAASMSVVDKDEKLASLVLDARRLKIMVQPPDINLSSGRIEIADDFTLLAPLTAVKGISDNSAAAIVHLRSLAPGNQITSIAHLQALAEQQKMGAKCNVAHRERLQRVGAFYSVEGGLKPMHPDRLKDRLELMPGFTVDAVKADRKIQADTYVMSVLVRQFEEVRQCGNCSLKGSIHVAPRMGKTPKFMVVFDSPNWQEEKRGQMLEGEAADFLKSALKDAGLSPNDGYYTALVRSVRPKAQKVLAAEQINGCSEYLRREIDVLKPPVILAMGSAAIRFFAPNIKGNASDLVGKVVFDPKLDASIVFGLNPAQVLFDTGKIAQLQTVAAKTAEIVQ